MNGRAQRPAAPYETGYLMKALLKSRREKSARRFRIVDARGGILLDLLQDYEARAAVEAWNGRPIGKQFPARMIPLIITVREARR